MKIIAVNGSPNKDGNTAFALQTVANELIEEGIEVDFLHIGKENIKSCIACNGCARNQDEKCVLKDDNLNEYIQKLKNADGMILGSPVHFSAMSAAMKCFLDRVFYVSAVNGSLFRQKVGASVVAVRRSGGLPTFDQLNHFINYSEMIMPSSNYWNVIHGAAKGEAQQDLEGVQIMKILGKNMAWILKVIENGKTNVKKPESEDKIFTNFIR